jgi:uncharacterized integral membrane protein
MFDLPSIILILGLVVTGGLLVWDLLQSDIELPEMDSDDGLD